MTFQQKALDGSSNVEGTLQYRIESCRVLRVAQLTLWVAAVVVGSARLARGGPGDGLDIDGWTIRPFADIAATYDSNVTLVQTNETDDIYSELLAGIDLSYGSEETGFDGRGFLTARRYSDLTGEDFDGHGVVGSAWTGNRKRLRVHVKASYRSIDDYDRATYIGNSVDIESQRLALSEDRSLRVSRDLSDIHTSISRQIAERLGIGAGFSVRSQEYESEELFDTEEREGYVSADLQTGAGNTLLLNGVLGKESNDSFAEDADYSAIRAGATRTTPRLRLTGTVGYDRFDWQGRETQEDGSVVERTEPVDLLGFDLSGRWRASHKVALELFARNAIQSAHQYAATANRLTLASLSAVYSASRSITLTATGSYRQDDFQDPVRFDDEFVDRTDDRLAGLLRLDYSVPRGFLDAYAEVSYEDTTSTIDELAYTQLRAALGLAVRY